MVICAKMAESIEMPFGLWARMGPENHVLDRGRQVLRDLAMATIFVFQWAITLVVWSLATRCLILWVFGL